MNIRLLAVASAVLLQPAPAADAVVAAPFTVCTSLVNVCPIACTSDSLITVRVVGDGYGDAKCGSATAYCYTSGGTCSRSQYVSTGGSWIRCLVDPFGTTPTIAICSTQPFVN